MIVWIDAQLSPHLAPWLSKTFSIQAYSLVSLGLRDAQDREVFLAARQSGASIMSKDHDFVDLVTTEGPPPQIIFITCGNTSNAALHNHFHRLFPRIMKLLKSGEPLVELPGSL